MLPKKISTGLRSIGLGIASLLVPASLWAQGGPGPDGYNYGPHMMGWGGGWLGMMLGPLFMILMLAAVVILAVFIFRALSGHGPRHGDQTPSTSSALEILKSRYARGEIDREEFEERRRVLVDHG